jgi:Tfp pilus assembly protein PilV
MSCRSGFTLTETLVTTLVLVTGLVAIAGAFSYGVQSSRRIRQQTTGTALLYTKMEELRASRDFQPGHYSETIVITSDSIYLRSWEITPEMPHRITVTIYGKQSGGKGTYLELAHATTLVAREF